MRGMRFELKKMEVFTMDLRKSLRVFGLVFVIVCVAVPLALQADVYIKQQNHTDGFSMMGQSSPPQDQTFEIWMSPDKARMDQGDEVTIIVRMDEGMMYMLNNKEMKYTEMPIGDASDILTAGLAGSDMSDEEKAQAEKMMKGFAQMMKPKVSVTATGETQNIKGWNCKKYIMTMEMMGTKSTQEVWATEDIKIDFDMYRALAMSMMSQMPGLEDMMKEMEKIKGITVMSTGTTSMMGTDVKSSQELLEVSEKSAPAGAYDVPAGYKKEK
jgi:hypothetical protein